MTPPPRCLYLHGFGSSRDSTKGLHFREQLARDGVELELLDLNVPSFETQTYTAILKHIERAVAAGPESGPLILGGSSMGGYLAARYAELHPDAVARLFLLCPGFDLVHRWPVLLGEAEFRKWEATGSIDVTDDAGTRPLHWEFVRDARTHPAFPEVPCPCRIVHGTRDEVVPIESSRIYAAAREHVELIEVDDDHRLLDSLDRLTAAFREVVSGS